jgi:DNA-binding PadR family transcriptional regulator
VADEATAQQPWQLNATAGSLLGFLLEGPRSGWDLARDAKREIGNFWNITQSQVYRELRNLEERGLVTAEAATGSRERRPYAITDAGRDAFREWIALPPGEELIRFPLLVSVLFADHVEPARLRRWLREHELAHLRRLDDYERQAAGLPSAARGGKVQTLRFGIEYERAVLRWFASAFADLTSGADLGDPTKKEDAATERLRGGT